MRSYMQCCAVIACSVAQSCLILCIPIDCSPPGSSKHGISQVRILEWVAIPFFRGSSWPKDRTQVSHPAGRFFTVWATMSLIKSEEILVILSFLFSLSFPSGTPTMCMLVHLMVSYMSLGLCSFFFGFFCLRGSIISIVLSSSLPILYFPCSNLFLYSSS